MVLRHKSLILPDSEYAMKMEVYYIITILRLPNTMPLATNSPNTLDWETSDII